MNQIMPDQYNLKNLSLAGPLQTYLADDVTT